MASEDLRRAERIKQLYDECLAKSDPKKDLPGRHAAAARLMDQRVGSRWRVEIKMPDITIITAPGEEGDDDRSFFDRLADAMDDEGLGTTDTEEPELPLKERVQRKLSDRRPR